MSGPLGILATAGLASACAALLARALRLEAGSRPARAIEAVAAMLANRAAAALVDPATGPGSLPGMLAGGGRLALLADICRALLQGSDAPSAAMPAGEAVEAICRRVAARAVAGTLPDPTDGATHCHDIGELPRWALGQVPVAEIGGLVFYRLAGGGKP